MRARPIIGSRADWQLDSEPAFIPNLGEIEKDAMRAEMRIYGLYFLWILF
jgi:hypothetical protein